MKLRNEFQNSVFRYCRVKYLSFKQLLVTVIILYWIDVLVTFCPGEINLQLELLFVCLFQFTVKLQ